MKVLLVEDDPAIAGAIIDALEAVSWRVTHAAKGHDGLDVLEHYRPDILVVDLGLPDMDGIEVVRRAREREALPIIVISARGEEADRVLALELGADDYLVKPFGIRELLARIRAVHRRSSEGATQLRNTDLIQLGPLTVDGRQRRVTLGGTEVALTTKEFDLLHYLASDPGTVFRRETILQDVWDMNWYGSTKTLDVHIASLRKKLGDPRWIESVRGVGFKLHVPS